MFALELLVDTFAMFRHTEIAVKDEGRLIFGHC